MRMLALTAMLCVISVPALAQQITINAVCQQAEAASADGAEYVPGVDAEGKPVVPADLSQPVKAIQYPIVVPIEIDVLKFLELDVSAALKDSTEIPAQVAYVTLFEDGRVEYNGQDISQDVAYNCVEKLPEEETTPAAALPEAAPAAVTATPAEAPKAAAPQQPAAPPKPAEATKPVETPKAPETKSTPANEQKQ